jgi:hypothetical protein
MPDENVQNIEQLLHKLQESISQSNSRCEPDKRDQEKSPFTVDRLKIGFSGISTASFYSQSPAGRIRLELQLLDGRKIAFCFANLDAAEQGKYRKIEYRDKSGRILQESLQE